MNTIAIDKSTLNGLFDNQKKLDDLFDSIFDDDNYFITSSSPSTASSTNKDFRSEAESLSYYSSNSRQEASFNSRNSSISYLLPIGLEIGVIYLIAAYLL